jgi:hypothetical protein
MFSIKTKVNGKEVPLSQFGDKLAEAATESVREQLRERIEAVSCPIHSEYAKAILKSEGEGQAGPKLNYEIKGCCDALIQEVYKTLGAETKE